MRRTAKYTAALSTVPLLGDGKQSKTIMTMLDHDELYATLEKRGYYWDAKDKQWHKGDENSRAKGQFSGSMFEDPDGLPTGVFRLRIMAHPDELAQVCAEVCRKLTVIEVSKPYDNRRGAGQRTYITCKRSTSK
jgi:hypothetical protein